MAIEISESVADSFYSSCADVGNNVGKSLINAIYEAERQKNILFY